MLKIKYIFNYVSYFNVALSNVITTDKLSIFSASFQCYGPTRVAVNGKIVMVLPYIVEISRNSPPQFSISGQNVKTDSKLGHIVAISSNLSIFRRFFSKFRK